MYGFRLPPNPIRWCLIITVCGVLGPVGSVLSVVPDKIPTPQTTITSQSMTAQGKERKAFFDGTVVLTQGDMVIHSDHMVVTFKPEDKGPQSNAQQPALGQQIEMIVATGKVVIEKSTGKATSGRAVYYKDEEKVVLTESPVACQQGTRVTGSRMTMYLNEDRSIVEGGSRVIIENEEGTCH